MAFETIRYRFQEIGERLESYLDSRGSFYKLKLLKILSKTTVSILSFIIFGGLFLFVLLFLSIGAAFWLGTYFESAYAGFLLIGAFYGLLVLLMFIFGRRIIEQKIVSNFSDLFYEDDEDDRKHSKKNEVNREMDELELLIREEARRRERNR